MLVLGITVAQTRPLSRPFHTKAEIPVGARPTSSGDLASTGTTAAELGKLNTAAFSFAMLACAEHLAGAGFAVSEQGLLPFEHVQLGVKSRRQLAARLSDLREVSGRSEYPVEPVACHLQSAPRTPEPAGGQRLEAGLTSIWPDCRRQDRGLPRCGRAHS